MRYSRADVISLMSYMSYDGLMSPNWTAVKQDDVSFGLSLGPSLVILCLRALSLVIKGYTRIVNECATNASSYSTLKNSSLF